MNLYRITALRSIDVVVELLGSTGHQRLEMHAGELRDDVVRIERVTVGLRTHHFGVPHPVEIGKPVTFQSVLEITRLG